MSTSNNLEHEIKVLKSKYEYLEDRVEQLSKSNDVIVNILDKIDINDVIEALGLLKAMKEYSKEMNEYRGEITKVKVEE